MKHLLAILAVLALAGCSRDRYETKTDGDVTIRTDKSTGASEIMERTADGRLTWTPIAEAARDNKKVLPKCDPADGGAYKKLGYCN